MTVEVNIVGMLYQRNAKSMNRWMTPASSKPKVLFLMYLLASTQYVNLCFVPIRSLLFLKIFNLCFDVILYLTLVIRESTF